MRIPIDSLYPIKVARHHDGAADKVVFDLSAWRERYPNLTKYHVEVTAPNGDVYLPAIVEQLGDDLEWTIMPSDTATEGNGAYQIVGVGDNSERKTSASASFVVRGIMPGTASETPPDPAKPWVDKVLDAAERAEAAAERAENAGGSGGSGGGGITKETDPTVPEWAKQPNPPTYTAEDVGAASKESVDRLNEEIVDLNKVAVKSINGAKPDENGNVQVEGGGSEGVYELIETITLEEAVNRVNLGPYNLKKVYVEVITPVADGDSAGVIAINGINAVYVARMVATSSIYANGRIIKCVADTENGMLRCFGHACNNSDYAQEGLSPLYQKAFAGYTAAKIETVSVFESLGAKTLPEGTVITIKGVRA